MSIGQYNNEIRLELSIDHNTEIIKTSLGVADEGIHAVDPDKMSCDTLMEQIDSIIEYLRNAQYAAQRKMVYEGLLKAQNERTAK